MSRFRAVAITLVVASCTNSPQPGPFESAVPRERSRLPETAPSDYQPGRDEIVVLSLPIQNTLALLDPKREVAWQLVSLEETPLDSPFATAVVDERIALVDSFAARVALVDASTGGLEVVAPLMPFPAPPPGILRDPGQYGQDIMVGPDGFVYVLVDEEINSRGFLFKLDPRTLEVVHREELGPYPVAAAADAAERIWVVGSGRKSGWVRIIDLQTMRGTERRLPGRPSDLFPGPTNTMLVPLSDTGRVIELQPNGKVSRDTRALSQQNQDTFFGTVRTAGLFVSGNHALVAVPPGEVVSIDLEDMSVAETVDVGEDCADTRDLVIAEGRGIVTCAANGRVAILGLDPLRLSKVINVAQITPLDNQGGFSEEPRGLAILPAKA